MFNTFPRLLNHLRRRVDPSTISNGDVLAWDGDNFAPATGGGGGPETDPIAIHPGESLTKIVGDNGGVAYESLDNVPIFAFRTTGDTFDRVKIWANGEIRIGRGNAAPQRFVEADTDDELGIGDDLIRLDVPGVALAFFGTTPESQPSAIANATDAASTQARLNDVLAALRALGLIAT